MKCLTTGKLSFKRGKIHISASVFLHIYASQSAYFPQIFSKYYYFLPVGVRINSTLSMDKFYLNNKEEINRIKMKLKVLVTQSCPTFCDPKNCSPPGSSVCEIIQARILEWVDITFSRGSSPPGVEPGSTTFQADS